jgi:hypothetical protein
MSKRRSQRRRQTNQARRTTGPPPVAKMRMRAKMGMVIVIGAILLLMATAYDSALVRVASTPAPVVSSPSPAN